MSSIASIRVDRPVYHWGATVLLVASVTIVAALAFEVLGGYKPCPLCLQQRYAYYGGIPLAVLALASLRAGHPAMAALLFAVVALAFLGNAGLGIYHAGAEWGLWPGPATCATAFEPLPGAGGLLKELGAARVVRCDVAAWRFAGLSFAGWNVVISLGLSASALVAAITAVGPREPPGAAAR